MKERFQRSFFLLSMETIIVVKTEMKTIFDPEGRAFAATGLKPKTKEKDNLGELFKEGEIVSVAGISKGKGFAGAVKRWGFKGGPRTHGQSDRERAPGSSGSTTTPGRVLKGLHRAGRMGSQRVTVKNLKVLTIDQTNNLLWVKGAVPGKKGSRIELNKLA